MNVLSEAKSTTQSLLQGLSTNVSKFGEIVGIAFGEDYDVAVFNSILTKWQASDFSDLPNVTVLPTADLFGAVGAYSSELNQVYLSDSFVNANNVDLLNSVLLEEYGHFLDAKINRVDTVGDEGAVFSLLARGEEVSPDLLASLRAENDSNFARVDGVLVAVENANITLVVNTTVDQNDGLSNNGLSLRDAILIANSDTANLYTIELQSGQTYSLTQEGINEDAGKTGDLDIASKANVTIKTPSGVPAIINAGTLVDRERVFTVFSDGGLNLNNITVTGGSVGSRISSNAGGGILVDGGTLNILNSTISNNFSSFGGAIFVSSFSKRAVTIDNSTIANNVVDGGGGAIYVGDAITSISINNSTISGNTANGDGGGIYYNSLSANTNTTIVNSTITNNIADRDNDGRGDGGGISNGRGSGVTLANSIVAGNFDTPTNNLAGTIRPDISGQVNGNRFNLIGDLRGAAGTIGTGTDIVNNNPRLAPLGNYGGVTQTHGLRSGSPAVNTGSNSLIPTDTLDLNGNGIVSEPTPFDQRGTGFSRIVGVNVDIGAFEGTLPAPTVETSIFRFQNSGVPGTYLFVGEAERQNILKNFTNFKEEGVAFKVATQTGDGLIPLNRFQNSAVPGTYLYAGESESVSIRKNNTNFKEEGIAFYVYSPGVGGSDFNRFQNKNLAGTYLFAGPSETANILTNFRNFVNEGVAFGAVA